MIYNIQLVLSSANECIFMSHVLSVELSAVVSMDTMIGTVKMVCEM